MSLAGLKKQINKANQFLSEQMGQAEATKLDDQYNELERKIDITDTLVTELLDKTREYLQPNPATRLKMVSTAYLGKVRGSGKGAAPYPQPEGELGECMSKHGRGLGESAFGHALVDCGEAFRQMADIKYNMEDTIKQNFLDPLTVLQTKDLKETVFHRKKLQGRRLDYDCKKRQKATDEEMLAAEEKLEESKRLAETAIWNVLDNDTEQVSQLCALVEAQLDFHRRTTQILEGLKEQLKTRVKEASGRTRHEHAPTPVLLTRTSSRSHSPMPGAVGGGAPMNPFASAAASTGNKPSQDPWGQSGGYTNNHAPQASSGAPPAGVPSARALYDFEAENPGELALKEGQVVQLVNQIDENWFDGKLPNGKTGFFPVNYVQVIVPIKK